MQTVHGRAVGEIPGNACVYARWVMYDIRLDNTNTSETDDIVRVSGVIQSNTRNGRCPIPCQAAGDRLQPQCAIPTRPFSKGLVMTETVLISVRLPASVADAANAAADQRNISRSKLLRIAIERFLDDLSGSSEQDRRRQFSFEYSFLALDLMVQREYPEVHAELLNEAERRMEAFHGAA